MSALRSETTIGGEILREIKFRGKSVKSGEWVYGYLIGRVENSGRPCQGKYFIDNGEPFNTAVEVDPQTIGQNTGFADIDGDDVYEGDLVGILGEDGECVVRWDFETCAFYAGHRILGACIDVIPRGTIYDQEESA